MTLYFIILYIFLKYFLHKSKSIFKGQIAIFRKIILFEEDIGIFFKGKISANAHTLKAYDIYTTIKYKLICFFLGELGVCCILEEDKENTSQFGITIGTRFRF